MRLYRRTAAANWSWRCYFLTKSRYVRRYPTKKAPVKFFDIDAEKGVPHRRTRFPQKKNKRRSNVFFLFQNGAYPIPKSSPGKILEKSGKIKFHTKNRQSVPSSSTVFVGVKIVYNYIYCFLSFWLTRFVFLVVLAFSILCDIWIGLFDFPCGVNFLISLLLSRFGPLWRPRFCRGICQAGYIVPETWEPQSWSIKTAVSIICKKCLWKAILSDNLIHFFILLTSWLRRSNSESFRN